MPQDPAPRKPTLATTWLDGCSGCHMSFVDLDERLLEVAELVDLVYSPLVDTKDYPDWVDICLVEGAFTWGVMGSGIGERVVTDMGTPWGESATCTSCGKCVQVCPTGALFEKGRSVGEGSKARRPFLPYLAAVRARGS